MHKQQQTAMSAEQDMSVQGGQLTAMEMPQRAAGGAVPRQFQQQHRVHGDK